MRTAHKADERFFLLGEMRHASAFKVIDDQTGDFIATTVIMMLSDPDSWLAYVTEDGGATFRRSALEYREFPFPPTLVQLVDAARVETGPERIAELRLAITKWQKLLEAV